MPGTREGAIKARNTNRRKYGKDYYKKIGKVGGEVEVTKGFGTDHELAREAGQKGGRISRRGE